jgi:integrase
MGAFNVSKITLYDAYRMFYLPELKSSGASPRTVEHYVLTLRRWERFAPKNPPVTSIDNCTLSAFRQAMVDAGLRPSTFNGAWRDIRSILRRLGPQETRNPLGMGLLTRIPHVRMLRENLGVPRRVSPAEIDAFYAACGEARWPRCCVPAAEWWRCAVVLALNTGLRRNDLFGLRTENFELDGAEPRLQFVATKTRKSHSLPLNQTVVNHLRGIWSPRTMLFPGGQWILNGSHAYVHEWSRLQSLAGVAWSLHDLRRSCGSTFAAIAGVEAARYVLQHASKGSDTCVHFYVNFSEQVSKAARDFPQPPSFLAAKHFVVPPPVRRVDFQFLPGAVIYRGQTIALPSRPLAVLQALVLAGRPLGFRELARVAWWDRRVDQRTVKGTVFRLRQILCRALRLQDDPLPFDRFTDRGWRLALPAPPAAPDSIGREMAEASA